MWFSPEKLRYGLLGNWWCHVIDSCLIDFCADATKAAPLRVHLLEKKKKKMSAIWVLNVKTPMTRVSKSKPDTCTVMPFVLCDGWTHCIKWATCKQAHSHCSKLHTAGEQDNTHGKKHRPSLNMTFSITRQTTFTMVYRKWIDRGPNIGLGHIIKTEKHNKSCCFFQTVICDGSFPIKITIEYCCMCDLALV